MFLCLPALAIPDGRGTYAAIQGGCAQRARGNCGGCDFADEEEEEEEEEEELELLDEYGDEPEVIEKGKKEEEEIE